MTDDAEFVGHEPCPACGSRDNLARYADGYAKCYGYGCDYWEPGERYSGKFSPKEVSTVSKGDFLRGEVKPLTKRGISEETCRKFSYRLARLDGQPVAVADYYDPAGHQVVAQKLRFKDKSFAVKGKMKEAGLFGQHLWRDQGKMVVITEGEIDALSVSQVQNNRWPVVSLQNGAQSARKSIARAIEWLDGFERVVLFFDNDEPGRLAAQEAALALPTGKAFIAKIPEYKDANEALMAGDGSKIVDAIWGAKEFRPDGIVTLDDILDDVLTPMEWGLPWWLDELTQLTYGRRPGELIGLGAGTGIGKTDFILQQVQHDLVELKQDVACFFLEQPTGETGKRLAGKHAGKTFHVPDTGWTEEELIAAVDDLKSGGRLFLYDSFGRNDFDVIERHIRYLAQSEDVKLFYLDHLTALAQGSAAEVSAELEVITERAASLCKELGIILHFVSHLSTPDGKPHEEGGRVMIRHFKGSRAIGFWSHTLIGLERNQQADEEDERKTTTLRILKHRYYGKVTGETVLMSYEDETSRLMPKALDVFGDDDKEDPPF